MSTEHTSAPGRDSRDGRDGPVSRPSQSSGPPSRPLSRREASRPSIEPPPSSSLSMLPPPPAPTRVQLYEDAVALVEHFGELGRMTAKTFVAIFRRPLEIHSTLYQMESL